MLNSLNAAYIVKILTVILMHTAELFAGHVGELLHLELASRRQGHLLLNVLFSPLQLTHKLVQKIQSHIVNSQTVRQLHELDVVWRSLEVISI